MSPRRRIISGQSVHAEKKARARELRQEMTPAERLMWERLRSSQLKGLKFRRQQVIDGFVADFYCHAAGLVVEVDGPVHEEQVTFDATRDNAFQRRGLTVLRVTNDEVFGDLEGVLGKIVYVASRAGGEAANLTPPAPLSEAERGRKTTEKWARIRRTDRSPPLRFGEGG